MAASAASPHRRCQAPAPPSSTWHPKKQLLRWQAWNIRRGPEGHVVGPMSAAFSADGRLLATGSNDGRILIRDTSSGRIRARIKAPAGVVTRLRFGPRGRVLAAVINGDSDSFGLWDTRTGSPRGQRWRQIEAPEAMRFSGSGRLLAIVDRRGDTAGLMVLRTANGAVLHTLPNVKGTPRHLRFLKRDTALSFTDGRGHLQTWLLKSRKLTRRKLPATPPDRWTVVKGARRWYIRRRGPRIEARLRVGGPIKRLVTLPGKDAKTARSPDGRWLAVARDGLLRIFDLTRSGPPRSFQVLAHQGLDAVVFGPSSRQLFLMSYPEVKLIDLPSGRRRWAIRGLSQTTAMVFDPRRGRLFVATEDRRLTAWDLEKGGARHLLRARAPIVKLAISADGRRLAGIIDPEGASYQWMVATDGRYHRHLPRRESTRQMVVWDARTGRTVVTLGRALATTTGLALCPDGSLLAVCNQQLTLVSIPSGRVWKRRGPCNAAVAFTPDGGRIVTSSWTFARRGSSAPMPAATIRSWDLATGRLEGHIKGVDSSAFLLRTFRSGRRVATASAMSASIEVWGLPAGPRLRSLDFPQGAGTTPLDPDSLVVSPAGLWLAAADDDLRGVVTLWSLRTGRRMRTIRPARGVYRLASGPRGRYLAVAEHGGALSLWRVATDR